MLKTRIYTVLVLLPLLLAALFYLPPVAWALFLLPLLLVGAWEWARLAGWHVTVRLAYAGAMAAGGFLLWCFAYGAASSAATVSLLLYASALLFWLLIVPLWLAKAWQNRAPLLLAITGAVLLLPLWLALVQLQSQPKQLLALMAIVWISDTAAYVCGRCWGRRKLAVTISPGKTWEGAWGALAGVALYYVIIGASGMMTHPVLHGLSGFAIFMVMALLGIEGDLFESWIKRVAGVKDSGAFFPGHGGVLDRIDALTASMPLAALLLGVMT